MQHFTATIFGTKYNFWQLVTLIGDTDISYTVEEAPGESFCILMLNTDADKWECNTRIQKNLLEKLIEVVEKNYKLPDGDDTIKY